MMVSVYCWMLMMQKWIICPWSKLVVRRFIRGLYSNYLFSLRVVAWKQVQPFSYSDPMFLIRVFMLHNLIYLSRCGLSTVNVFVHEVQPRQQAVLLHAKRYNVGQIRWNCGRKVQCCHSKQVTCPYETRRGYRDKSVNWSIMRILQRQNEYISAILVFRYVISYACNVSFVSSIKSFDTMTMGTCCRHIHLSNNFAKRRNELTYELRPVLRFEKVEHPA